MSSATDYFYNLFYQISEIGSSFPIIIALTCALVILLVKKNEFSRAVLLVMSLGSYPISMILKLIFKVSRPEGAMVTQHFSADKYSFPSSHVMFYTVFWGYLLLNSGVIFPNDKILRRSLQVLSLLLILLIAMSRIYLGVHTLTDVLGGYVFGLAYLLILKLLERKFVQKDHKENK